jgi:hypothetical protein
MFPGFLICEFLLFVFSCIYSLRMQTCSCNQVVKDVVVSLETKLYRRKYSTASNANQSVDIIKYGEINNLF